MAELKGNKYGTHRVIEPVAPHVGAWIEIVVRTYLVEERLRVAPHVGAWIEIEVRILADSGKCVAPHVGAWIEIPTT